MNGNYDFNNYESDEQSNSSGTDFDANSTYFDENAIIGNKYENETPKQSEDDIKKEKNASTVSLILGLYTIISVFVCCGAFNIVTGIISIVYAVKAKKLTPLKKMSTNAKVGFICSIIGMALGVLTVFYTLLMILLMSTT